jgi:hypothetical protein
MSEIITNPAWLDAAWLTETLHRNGHLSHGCVTELAREHFHSYFANFYRLSLTFSPDAAPELPRRMLIKVSFAREPSAVAMGREEVVAYRYLRAQMPDPPIPRCFAAESDDAIGASYLVLEDLVETHFRGDVPDDISQRHWELDIEALAQLHAFWWEHEALGDGIGQLFTAADVDEMRTMNEEAVVKFFQVMGDEIDAETRRSIQATVDFLPGFWRRRLTSRAGNTLIHGDAHSWNILMPVDANNGRAYLIDLATMRVRPATNDLAYLMAMKWWPERRARLEMPLLRHYHGALVARGVTDYSWDECLLDYRHSILTHLTTPVVQCARGFLSPGIWRANFGRIIAAFNDLNCRELVIE